MHALLKRKISGLQGTNSDAPGSVATILGLPTSPHLPHPRLRPSQVETETKTLAFYVNAGVPGKSHPLNHTLNAKETCGILDKN